MTLLDLLSEHRTWDANDEDGGTIYVARPWSIASEAIILAPAPGTIEPHEQGGVVYHYFLEVFVAAEVVTSYVASPEGKAASHQMICERLIAYAENDA